MSIALNKICNKENPKFWPIALHFYEIITLKLDWKDHKVKNLSFLIRVCNTIITFSCETNATLVTYLARSTIISGKFPMKHKEPHTSFCPDDWSIFNRSKVINLKMEQISTIFPRMVEKKTQDGTEWCEKALILGKYLMT